MGDMKTVGTFTLGELFEQVPAPLESATVEKDGHSYRAVTEDELARLNGWLEAVRAVRAAGPTEFQLGFKWSAVTVDGVPGVMVEIGRIPKGGKEPVGDVWTGVYCDPKAFIGLIKMAIDESAIVWPGAFAMRRAPDAAPATSDPSGSKVH